MKFVLPEKCCMDLDRESKTGLKLVYIRPFRFCSLGRIFPYKIVDNKNKVIKSFKYCTDAWDWWDENVLEEDNIE